MTYSVKHVFYTLQGEGAQAGRPAVFCRFAGCNLWSGLERDRATARCTFCDTDFVGVDEPGGGKYSSAGELAAVVAAHWQGAGGRPYVVCTGGEPLLQLDAPLIDAFHAAGFEIAIETNGTLAVPAGVDWICVSPKAGNPLVVEAGDELKVVYPQRDQNLVALARLAFRHHFIQPMDGPERAANERAAVEYCLRHPQWRLSLQTHKYLGIE
ncbi:7-carboxy-7-deazaguanine synthase [Arhodomonas sp. AD133]|uniref:7-carboxy-7-deazaguanine synthase n=1 Tax=Arhodomonas sp. AD133 TaxID=3415009 RepID=UPI003EBF6DE5